MHFVNFGTVAALIGCLLPLTAHAQDTLSKPALRANIAKYDPGLTSTLSSKKFTVKTWPSDRIADQCKIKVQTEEFNVDAVTTYEVKYADCGQTWILCRHSQSPLSAQSIFELWGSIPVRMRQAVRSATFLPSSKKPNGPAAYAQGQDQVYFGNLPGMNVRIHETIHSLEFTDAFKAPQPLDTNKVWLDAYNKDSRVVSDYARTNQIENLAETGVLAVYSELVKGGIGSIEPEKDKIINQVNVLKDQMRNGKHGGYLYSNTDTAKCTHRWANPKSVPKRSSSRIMKREPDSLEEQRLRARADDLILYDDILAVTSTDVKTVCNFGHSGNHTHDSAE